MINNNGNPLLCARGREKKRKTKAQKRGTKSKLVKNPAKVRIRFLISRLKLQYEHYVEFFFTFANMYECGSLAIDATIEERVRRKMVYIFCFVIRYDMYNY